MRTARSARWIAAVLVAAALSGCAAGPRAAPGSGAAKARLVSALADANRGYVLAGITAGQLAEMGVLDAEDLRVVVLAGHKVAAALTVAQAALDAYLDSGGVGEQAQAAAAIAALQAAVKELEWATGGGGP